MKARYIVRCALSITVATALLSPYVVFAQGAGAFPSKPVRIVMPVPTGGASDTSARLIAQALSNAWGQAVVVENKPGAGGVLAAQTVMASAPDGHTLLWGLSSMAGTPFVQKSSPFKSLGEFAPISTAVQFGYALYVSNEVPARSVAELKTYSVNYPDKLNYATNTLGEFMASVEVLKSAGIEATRVPYKGGAQLMTDLIGGQVQVNVGPILSGSPHARAGKIRALAVLIAQRHPQLPEVPTLAELGLPASTSPTWNALFAPRGTPPEITEKISLAVAAALAQPTLRGTLEQQGATPLGSMPQQLADAVEAAAEAWKVFVRDYDIPQE